VLQNTACSLDIRLYWAVKILFFGCLGKRQKGKKINKLTSKEGILCTTGFSKMPGLPQKSNE
jgi:hypothetical protein